LSRDRRAKIGILSHAEEAVAVWGEMIQGSYSDGRRLRQFLTSIWLITANLAIAALSPAHPASAQTAKIALATSLTGVGSIYGVTVANAARLAIEESNVAGGPPIELWVLDDHSTTDGARALARQSWQAMH
jgi:ABC-type branched-subunit amino acid transport system substrate-binding protein